MNRIALLCASTAAIVGAAWSPPSQAAQTVRCESANGRYQTCAVDTRGGVRLTRQLSSQGCWQNDTWGYDRNRIWVTNGCRAEFQVGDYQESGGNGSNNGAIAGVAVAALIGAALLANKNKDRDRDRYDNGYYDPGYGGGGGSNFRCESTNGRQVYCQIPFRGHVEVSRQLSKARCQYGVTWGVDGMRVWVNNGCRADFTVY